jgi:hypothetical protein
MEQVLTPVLAWRCGDAFFEAHLAFWLLAEQEQARLVEAEWISQSACLRIHWLSWLFVILGLCGYLGLCL